MIISSKNRVSLLATLLLCVGLQNLLRGQCKTFGNFPPPYTYNSVWTSNTVLATRYTLSFPAYLNGFGYLGNGTGSGMQMGLYSDLAGSPGTLIASSPLSTVGSGTVSLDVNTPVLLAPGDYWIGLVFHINSLNHINASSTATTLNGFIVHPFGAPFPANPTWGTFPGRDFNTWVNVSSFSIAATAAAICRGGSVTLTAVPAVTPSIASYSWSTSQQQSSIVVSPSVTTVYTITSTAGACVETKTVKVSVAPDPSVTISNSSPTLCGNPSATLVASGADTYSWIANGASPTLVVTPGIATSYTVTGTTTLGCTGTASTTVQPGIVPNLTVNSSSSSTLCAGTALSFSASGATSYSWFPGTLTGPTVTFTPPAPVTYTVTGAIGSCTQALSLPVQVDTGPSLSASSTATMLCPGGSATLTANGASTGFTWQPGGITGSTIVVSPAATVIYTLTGINASGCSSSYTFQQAVSAFAGIGISPSSVSLCAGASQTLVASGGSSYTWQPGGVVSSSLSINPSAGITYTVTGEDGYGCSAQNTRAVTVVPNPTVTANASFTLCQGSNAILSASGANSYVWQPGNISGANVIVTPSSTTVYTVTGSSAGCGHSATTTASVLAGPGLTTTATPAAVCQGYTTTLTSSGASSYTWLPGGTTGSSATASPSASTIYTVTGSNGLCTSQQLVSVFVNALPAVTLSPASATVCSGNTVTLNAGGANSYTWSPGNSTNSSVTVSPLVSSVYTVSGSNSIGCIRSVTVGVTVPAITLTPPTPTMCYGTTLTLNAAGAQTYTWTNSMSLGSSNGSSLSVSPFIDTEYTVRGYNSMGCLVSASATLTLVPAPIITSFIPSVAICPGYSTLMHVCCGDSYLWSPGNYTVGNPVLSPSVTTVYTAAVSNGTCSNAVTVTVAVIQPTLTVTASSPTLCSGLSTTLTASGAYHYSWFDGSSASVVVVSPSVTTTYTVWGITITQCAISETVQVVVVPSTSLSVAASPNGFCAGGCATLSASGGSVYTWLPGNMSGSTVAVCPSASTTYTVHSGCKVGKIPLLDQTPVLSVSASSTLICQGGSATLQAGGAASYTWYPGALTGSVITVAPTALTIYTVNGESAFGCRSSYTFAVGVSTIPVLSLSAASPSLCRGSSLTATATGGASYTWNPGAATGSVATLSPSVTTTYTVTGNNLQGCSSQTTLLLNVLPVPTVAISGNAAICKGSTLNLQASGAVGYTWQPGAVTGSLIVLSPASNTNYTVTGSGGGCSATAVAQLTVHALPSLTVSALSPSVCSGSSASITASGAASYSWSVSGFTTASVIYSPAASTTYSVVGTSTNGCRSDGTVAITVIQTPTLTAGVSSASLCAGSTVTLQASGAGTYTWMPGVLSGSQLAVAPATSVIYSVTGSFGSCSASATVGLIVHPGPTLSISAPAASCSGETVTLSASGASNYSWLPVQQTGTVITHAPQGSLVYTVTGKDVMGCTGQATHTLAVSPTPTLVLAPANAAICSGKTATLSVSGASQFTWHPGAITATQISVGPSVTTTYTVSGSLAQCSSTAFVTLTVNPLPSALTASVSGTITCSNPTVNLFSSALPAGLNYTWSGPQSFSSAVQNPAAVAIPGNFTVTATHTLTGCSSFTTLTVQSANPAPSLTASVSGDLNCSVSSVTLQASATPTAVSYQWAGPLGYTSAVQQPVITVPGNYTVSVKDPLTGCASTKTVAVAQYTSIVLSASISAATCSAGLSLNNGTIRIFNFEPTDRYDLVSGSSYTGTLTYTNAILIASSGLISSTLVNPTVTVAYTLRLFNPHGCVKDTTLYLQPVDCRVRTLGISKSVTAPVWKPDRWYHLEYAIFIGNYDHSAFSNVQLQDDLAKAFPSAEFAVVSLRKSPGSSLALNPAYDGITQTHLTNASLSSIAAGKTDTLLLALKVRTARFHTAFSNSASGSAVNGSGAVVSDSSQAGQDPDPDKDLDPTNNSMPTVVRFLPAARFGLSKKGECIKLQDNSIDISYTITAHNLGSDTLRNISIDDSLAFLVITDPARYTIRSAPRTSGLLPADASFNGAGRCGLILPENKLAPGQKESVQFAINLKPDTLSVVYNQARGKAYHMSNGDTLLLHDLSGSGDNPDLDEDMVCDEVTDNTKTGLELPLSLFIPQAFSPNGDQLNDVFRIRGLPRNSSTELMVFNRWGDRVYHHEDYSHAAPWDGSANTGGTLGTGKLPQGTYYFILDMKNSGLKPVTGFVILKY